MTDKEFSFPADLLLPQPGAEPRTGPEPIQDMQPVFHEEFDIDFEADTESMFVPKFELGSGARFINDFEFVSVERALEQIQSPVSVPCADPCPKIC